jgi:hypothetical protein
MSREYGCGHEYISWFNMEIKGNRNEYPYFIKWKYSVGSSGDRSMCYDCWKKSLGEDI